MPASTALSRNSIAEFFIRVLENGEHIRETFSISNRPEGFAGDNN